MWRQARSLPARLTRTPPLGFAGDGFVVKELADTVDEIDQLQGIAIDADGRYVVSGFKFPEHAVVARFWP